MADLKKKIFNFNKNKILFTPGPSSLSYENINEIKPCFGRGDEEYIKLEKKVLNKIKKISGHTKIARLQGSASLAIEIMIYNFVYGKVLIIDTGVYSERLKNMGLFAKSKFKYIKNIQYVEYKDLNNLNKTFDWIIACPVETSTGFKIPIENLHKLKKKI